MKILFLSYYYLPLAGAATWCTFHLSRELALKGNDICLIVPNVRYRSSFDKRSSLSIERQNPSGVQRTPLFSLPQRLAPILSPIFLLAKGLRVRDADIILCQFHPHHLAMLVGVILGRVHRLPVVARADDVLRDMGNGTGLLVKMLNVLNEHFIGMTDAFLVVCNEQKKILESRIGPSNKIGVSHNATIKRTGTVDTERAKKALGFDPSQRIILFTGRSSGAEYRIGVVFRAFAILQRVFPGALLVLVGDINPKFPREEQSEVLSNVRVFGPTLPERFETFLAAADVCIGPMGPMQTINIKVLEYMACGKPVVTGIRSESQELAVDGFNCICVVPEPKLVASAIARILENEEYGIRLGRNAARTASKFTWDNVATELQNVLVDVLRRKASSQGTNHTMTAVEEAPETPIN